MIILMHTLKFQNLIQLFSLKFACVLLQNQPEEEEEYSLAVKRPKIIEKQLQFVCKPTHVFLQKPQFHALMSISGVLNEQKVQR